MVELSRDPKTGTLSTEFMPEPAAPARRALVEEDYMVLEGLDQLVGGELAGILVRVGARGLQLVTCPECQPHVPFAHRDGCTLGARGRERRTAARRWVDHQALRAWLVSLRTRWLQAPTVADYGRLVHGEVSFILGGPPRGAEDHEAHYLRRQLGEDLGELRQLRADGVEDEREGCTAKAFDGARNMGAAVLIVAVGFVVGFGGRVLGIW